MNCLMHYISEWSMTPHWQVAEAGEAKQYYYLSHAEISSALSPGTNWPWKNISINPGVINLFSEV